MGYSKGSGNAPLFLCLLLVYHKCATALLSASFYIIVDKEINMSLENDGPGCITFLIAIPVMLVLSAIFPFSIPVFIVIGIAKLIEVCGKDMMDD